MSKLLSVSHRSPTNSQACALPLLTLPSHTDFLDAVKIYQACMSSKVFVHTLSPVWNTYASDLCLKKKKKVLHDMPMSVHCPLCGKICLLIWLLNFFCFYAVLVI